MRRLVVEGLLADIALRQVVAQGVTDPVRVEPLALKINHLLLGPANEVTATSIRGVGVESIDRGQHVGFEQPPDCVIREVLAHVGRGGQKQQMVARPIE